MKSEENKIAKGAAFGVVFGVVFGIILGSVIDNTIDINYGILKPNIQLEYNADISPSSQQKFSYASNGTSYILENINS